MPYHIAAKNTWGGAWATTAAEALNSNTPCTIKQAADWRNGGQIPAAAHLLFMGEAGPLTLADAQDFPANTVALNAPLDRVGLDFTGTGGGIGRSILLGNQSDAAGSLDGCILEARGGSKESPNVDMRGNDGVNADRQMAALMFQGLDLTIFGWHVRAADHLPINNSDRVRTTGAGGSALNGYAPEASDENSCMIVRGAWGSTIYGCSFNGGTYGKAGLDVQYRATNSSPTANQSKVIEVYDCEGFSCGHVQIRVASGAGINASTGGYLPVGARIKVHDNIARDAFWGTTANNAARRHGNLLVVTGLSARGSDIDAYDNTVYGECQDAVYMDGCGGRFRYNSIPYLMRGFAAGASVDTYEASGANWANTTMVLQGNAIKFGLSAKGPAVNGGWMAGPLTAAGSPAWPAQFVLLHGNKAGYVEPISGQGLAFNGCTAAIVTCNEVDVLGGGPLLNGSATWNQYWIAQNYLRARGGYGLQFSANNVEAWAFNNIILSTLASVRFDASTSASRLWGRRNIMNDGTVSNGASPGSALWTDNITATPDYTMGVGPTAGGNCASGGDPYGILGARTSGLRRDVVRKLWNLGALPLGPRRV